MTNITGGLTNGGRSVPGTAALLANGTWADAAIASAPTSARMMHFVCIETTPMLFR